MGDDVRVLLEAVDVSALEQTTVGKPIQHNIKYRTATGRLRGFRADAGEEQTLQADLDSSDRNYQRRLGEILLATLLERYDTFGAFHHYPRPFLLGPTAFRSDTGEFEAGTHGGNTTRVRNVDMLMWLKFVRDAAFPRGDRAVLSCVRFHHGHRLPGVVAAEWFSFEAMLEPSQRPGTPRPHEPVADLQAILRGAFADGGQYTVIKAPGGINERLDGVIKTSKPVVALMWIAQRLLADRYVDPRALVAEATEEEWRQEHMLASALIGHMAYSIPKDERQREKPVPVGWFDVNTLGFVLEEVVLAPAARSGTTTGFSGAYDIGEERDENEEDEIALYDFDSEVGTGDFAFSKTDADADEAARAGMDTEIPLLDSSDEGDQPLFELP